MPHNCANSTAALQNVIVGNVMYCNWNHKGCIAATHIVSRHAAQPEVPIKLCEHDYHRSLNVLNLNKNLTLSYYQGCLP